jgi:hypothetical protein
MRKILIITLIGIAFNLNAQISIDSLLKKQGAQVGINKPDLQNIDLKLISLFPTFHDYKNIKERIKNLPNECLRCLDSIDFNEYGKDSLIIKIYSQNYAYKSSDSYRLGLNKASNNDSLWLYYIYYDMEMKSIIEDYTGFMNHKFDFSIKSKDLGDMKKTKRIVIIKDYN